MPNSTLYCSSANNPGAPVRLTSKGRRSERIKLQGSDVGGANSGRRGQRVLGIRRRKLARASKGIGRSQSSRGVCLQGQGNNSSVLHELIDIIWAKTRLSER